MLRILIAIAVTTLFTDASMACGGMCGKHDPIAGQQRAKCQSLIVPKGLTGPANKAEWKKCMAAPDSYK
jgi:hypothetical protein